VPGFGGEDEAAGTDDAGAGGAAEVETAPGVVADEAPDAGAGDELAGLPALAELAELADDDPPEVHPATRAATAETAATAAVALMAPNRRVRPAGFIQLILSFGPTRVIQPPKTLPD
jgi:hypothetical protein